MDMEGKVSDHPVFEEFYDDETTHALSQEGRIVHSRESPERFMAESNPPYQFPTAQTSDVRSSW